jgi:hypothetical protein
MQSIVRVMLGAALAAGLAAAGLGLTAYAQTTGATISDPVGPVPDPTHVPFVLPKDIKWNGTYGVQQTAILYGDPSKPGPYTLVYRWFPGHFSQPHFHDQPRFGLYRLGHLVGEFQQCLRRTHDVPLACRDLHH